MLASRLDAVTGCGWTTDRDVGGLAEAGEDVVERATRWGRDRLLLHRVAKGYRITDTRGEQSHWILTDPAQPRISAAMANGTQPRARAAMATSPTPRQSGDGPRPNPATTRKPTPRQSGFIEKTNRS